MTESVLVSWLVRTAIGGGLLLLACWLWQRRLEEPARRQRLGEWAVAAALVVAVTAALPAWLSIPVPTRPVEAPPAEGAIVPQAFVMMAEPGPVVEQLPEAPAVSPAAVEKATEATPWRLTDVLLVSYGVVAGAMLGHWLLANLAVWWLLRQRSPVSPAVAALFAEMAWPRRTRLVVTDRVQVPFSVGLLRPTVVLPTGLVEQATTEELRWVLAHELAHVARQDTRTCWLFILGQVLFFYLPWFWWLRRQVRLSQEYIADAAALDWAGSPADYAQFLVGWARPKGGADEASRRPPAMATPVTGSGSDLFRRVTMMLESKKPCEARVSRSWVAGLAGGLVAAGLLVGGVGLRAVAAEDNKPEKKEDAPKKETKKDRKRPEVASGLDKLFDGVGLDDEGMKELRERMQELRKQMDEMRKQMAQGGFQFQGQFPGGAIAFPGGNMVIPGGAFSLATTSPSRQRLGAQVRTPSKTLADQLDLPKDQGMVLEEVGPNSAAAKAGLKAHDILLELGGKPVPSSGGEFVKLIGEVKANTAVDAVVLRKGKKETVKGLSLPEAKPVMNFQPGGQGLGRLGAVNALGGGRGGMTSVVRHNDDFTTKHKEGGVTITIKGKVDAGKAKVSEVTIDDGSGQPSTYDSLDKVPAAHKDKVKKLAEMTAKGGVDFPAR